MAYIYDLSDQWAASGTVFTGIKMNVTDSASAAGSLLMDLQVGGVSKVSVRKDGRISGDGANPYVSLSQVGGTELGWSTTRVFVGNSTISLISTGTVVAGVNSSAQFSLQNSYLGFGTSINSPDLTILRDAANTLAQRNGVNAQAFNLYNTYTDASNYERGMMKFASNFLQIGTEKLGTGATRGMELSTPYGGPLVQQTNNVWEFCNTNRTFPSIRMACGSGAFVGASMQIGFNSADFFTSGTVDAGFKRSAAAIIGVTNGSTGGGSLEMQEVTAPAAPATNNVRIYAEDDGAGKTRLMARFATGAAQQIAIEP